MDKILAKADKEALVEIVKFAQKQGLKGAKGGWKDFLNGHDRKFGDYLSDPSRRSPDILIAFINTFFEEEQKIFSNILRRHRNHVAILKHMPKSLNNDYPFQRLVRLTHEHPSYLARYSFPSHDEDWVVVHVGKISKAKKSPDIVAIDCEMVLCQDGTEAVVQVCAVDKNLEVKLNLLVKPKDPVVNYRTDFTGIVAKDLEDVTTSLADVQRSLKKLLRHGTILVGHSLHNDLQALKIDHSLVIDTTHIFKYADATLKTPSLNNLCKSVLGYKIREEGEPHNCVTDAQAAMKIVLAKLEHGFDNPIEIERESLRNTEKLLLHRIPVGVTSTELLKLFSPSFDVEIQADFKIRGDFYSTFAVFKDPCLADEAFHRTHGLLEKDSSGRPQKFVSLQLSKGKLVNFYIRRMAPFCSSNAYNGEQRHSSQDIESLDGSKKYQNDKTESLEAMKIVSRCENEDNKRNDALVGNVNSELKAAQKRNADNLGQCIEETVWKSKYEKTKKKGRHDARNEEFEATERRIYDHLKTSDGGHAGDGEVPCSCEHMKQIDRLKQELRQRDNEIRDLQKALREYRTQDLN